MHVHFLDPYRARSSPIHRLDPRVKFILTLAFILTAALTPTGAWPAYVLLLNLVTGAALLSELGIGYVLRRALLALPFVLAALPVMFTLSGATLWSFRFFGWQFAITQPGLERFISITLKSWISVQAAIILTASTSFPDLLIAMRAVRIPRLLVAIFGLMWRYLFVLVDETLRLIRARAARSGVSDLPGARPGGRLAWRARVTGGMAGSLFLRAFDRSDRIYNAMLARGYDGEVRSLSLPRVSPQSWWILGACLGLLAMIYLVGQLFA